MPSQKPKGAVKLPKYILPFTFSVSDESGTEQTNGMIKPFPADMPPAMAYVPFQQWEEPYAPNKALAAGTMFPSLDLPFSGREAK